MTTLAQQIRTIIAKYPGICLACKKPIAVGQSIHKDSKGLYVHSSCSQPNIQLPPAPRPPPRRAREMTAEDLGLVELTMKQTLDEHYNALCQRLDRIMTGNPRITVTGGATSSIAETLRDSEYDPNRIHERAQVRFDHEIIKKWARDGFDRTALTLALNLHELGHIWHTPARTGRKGHLKEVSLMWNVLEDQRQEVLTSLQYPRAVDYLRFLNARALALSVVIAGREPSTRDLKIGRQFLMHYGRRHLFPPSVNSRLHELAEVKYGLFIVKEIENLIDEYLRLTMPSGQNRGWEIAERLAEIDDRFDPETDVTGSPVGSPLNSNDPRHDCGNRTGEPTLDQETRNRLKSQIRRLIQRPTRTKEPAPLPQKSRPKAPEPFDNEPADQTTDEELEEALGAHPEEAEGDGAGKGEDAPEKETAEDADTPPEMEGQGDGEGDDQEAAGKDGGNPSDELGDDEGDGDAEESNAPAQGAGRGQMPPPDPLLGTLKALAREALEEVAEEVADRHDAIKDSEFRPSMGGSRRGGLDSQYVDAARRLGHMFRDINQDLKATTVRAQRRGRLDSRRLPTALATNSSRIFKRRIPDMSTEAALAVHIMIDSSGSMYNAIQDSSRTSPAASSWRAEFRSKISVALPAGFALAKGVELAGHLAKVTTFSDGDELQKNWLDELYRLYISASGGGTDPTNALRKARPDFLYLEQETDIHNHVLIIITDGDFNGDAVPRCKELLTKLVKDGVHVIEIGIGVQPLPIHGAWKILTIPDVNGLTTAMVEPLRKLAIEIAKQAKGRVS